MMREVDTISPVVWPSWCYSVEGHGEAEGGGPDRKESHPSAAAKPRAKRRNNALMAVRYQRGETNGDVKSVGETAGKGDDKSDTETRRESGTVKAERLSPGGAASSLADQNSNSSRSCTPSSSYPSTPPDAPSHLKQMEHMMLARNYSDFMRSLAAKYNHTNPNDYFSSARNGYTQALDPRFNAFKTGATPFVGLMAPLGGSAVSPSTQPSTSTSSPNDMSKPKPPTDLFATNGISPFSASNLFSPMMDMSSTQALLNIVRTANAQNPGETFITKSPTVPKRANESSPLDLSSGAPVGKKVKREHRESMYSADFLSFPILDAIRTQKKCLKKPNSSSTVSSRFSPVSGAGGATNDPRTCETEQQSIAHWNVDDVCSFVTSIDICAEYEKNFRDERIDGSSLPLLTEEHLTNSLGMKLGPALKLRASLARRLGHCSICLHCVHCHNPSRTPTPAATPVPVASNSRPSSAGN